MITIGVDPGPRPGVCILGAGTPMLLQCDSAGLLPIVGLFLEALQDEVVHLAVEQWAMGPISGVAGKAGRVTRELIGELEAFESSRSPAPTIVHLRRAVDVFPWASDRRLAAAGLYERSAGMKDARSAARHALYSHVRDTGAPDPLRRARSS